MKKGMVIGTRMKNNEEEGKQERKNILKNE